jgi:hypothetical protein
MRGWVREAMYPSYVLSRGSLTTGDGERERESEKERERAPLISE